MLRNLISRLAVVCLLTMTAAMSWAASSDSILGYWRTIDDESGFAKAIVHIQNAQNGSYLSTIVATVERPDYTPAERCNNCPAPFTNRKIIGIPLLWDLRAASTNKVGGEQHYTGGYLIDPLSGKFYQISAKLSNDGRRLTLRGYIIGVPFIGRTQTWMRDTSYTPKN